MCFHPALVGLVDVAPSDPLPDVHPQLAQLPACLSVVVVKAALPASRSWSLLNGGQYALSQRLDSCVKTFMHKTPHCFSSAFCFWISQTSLELLGFCVRPLWGETFGGNQWYKLERPAYLKTLFPSFFKCQKWGLWYLACGPGDCLRKGPWLRA